jgi:hypothetical protein
MVCSTPFRLAAPRPAPRAHQHRIRHLNPLHEGLHRFIEIPGATTRPASYCFASSFTHGYSDLHDGPRQGCPGIQDPKPSIAVSLHRPRAQAELRRRQSGGGAGRRRVAAA